MRLDHIVVPPPGAAGFLFPLLVLCALGRGMPCRAPQFCWHPARAASEPSGAVFYVFPVMLYLICSRFVNGGYYFYFIGGRMADVMFGADFGGMDDFGQPITPQNVDAYIARQTELWLTLKD